MILPPRPAGLYRTFYRTLAFYSALHCSCDRIKTLVKIIAMQDYEHCVLT